MAWSVRIVPILLILLLLGIPALAATGTQEPEIKPAVIAPDVLQVKSKALWDAGDWLEEGNKLAAGSAKLAFTPFEGLGQSNNEAMQEQALRAYNEGLKRAGNDKAVTAALYAGKGRSFSSIGAPNMAIDAFAKAVENAPDNDSKAQYLRAKADALDSAGRKQEADAARDEANKLKPDPKASLPAVIVLCSLIVALVLFSRNSRG